jgi:hypothetical protein
MGPEDFYIPIAVEADEDYAVADIVHRGTYVAAVRATASGPSVATRYAADGVPLDGLIAALSYAREQLED